VNHSGLLCFAVFPNLAFVFAFFGSFRSISNGIDIWNGNSAVQIQPPMGADDVPMRVDPMPTAVLHGVKLTSKSGRGIVNIDGGSVQIHDCAVYNCAATGIYVGGPGSRALVERTDVIGNGIGNRSRRGIARGHSGIYLEQGHATIVNCNISNNTLTGISSVHAENAILTLEQSDLVNNGTFQLEMPPLQSLARRRSVVRENYMASVGNRPLRSNLLSVRQVNQFRAGTEMGNLRRAEDYELVVAGQEAITNLETTAESTQQ
jgi:hypothetical protein